MKQLEIFKERCELYKQRENNMKQISDYMNERRFIIYTNTTTDHLFSIEITYNINEYIA